MQCQRTESRQKKGLIVVEVMSLLVRARAGCLWMGGCLPLVTRSSEWWDDRLRYSCLSGELCRHCRELLLLSLWTLSEHFGCLLQYLFEMRMWPFFEMPHADKRASILQKCP